MQSALHGTGLNVAGCSLVSADRSDWSERESTKRREHGTTVCGRERDENDTVYWRVEQDEMVQSSARFWAGTLAFVALPVRV